MTPAETLDELARAAHATAVAKGWYDQPRSVPELLCLCHSELSEALEAVRNGDPPGKHTSVNAACEELADVVIRALDMAAFLGWPIGRAVVEKMAANERREYRHGGKRY